MRITEEIVAIILETLESTVQPQYVLSPYRNVTCLDDNPYLPSQKLMTEIDRLVMLKKPPKQKVGRKKKEVNMSMVKRLRAKGMTWREIAKWKNKKLGVSYTWLLRAYRRDG